MKRNGNNVNIDRESYHHGDLRRALVREGLRLLAARDAESLSLREVARAAGVSATSVYRHFPDKKALIAALAGEGLSQLSEAQRVAALEAGGGKAGFAATGRAYVRFALANPALFRLMFATPRSEPSSFEDTRGSEPGELLHANAVAAAASKGGEVRVHAVQAWALVHGIAMLMLDGQLPADEAIIDSAIN